MIIIALIAAAGIGALAALYPIAACILIGALAAIVAIIWLLDHPRALIATTLGVIILGQIGRIPPLSGDILLIDIFVGLLFVGWLVQLFLKREKIVMTSFHLLWLAFLLVALIGLVATPLIISHGDLIRNALYWVRLVLYSSMLWIVPTLIKTPQQGKQIMSWISGAGVILALIGFLQLVVYPDIGALSRFGWDPHVGRLVSTFLDPNYLGGFFALALAILLAFGIQKQERFPWLTVGILLIASVLTYSRSGYLAVGAVVLIFGLRYSWKLLLVTLCCVVPLSLTIPRVQERVAGGFSVDATSQARIKSWKNALIVIGHFPVMGVGYNNYKEAQEQLRILQGSAQSHAAAGSDSSLLNVEATTGFLGLGLFLAACTLLVKRMIKLVRSQHVPYFQSAAALALLFGGPAIIIHSFFVNSLFYPFIFFPLMLLVGLVFVNVSDEKSL